jgi:prephenate dehydrogenase
MSLDRVLVIGAGLVGASVGLALRARGVAVAISDRDPDRLRLAADLGAGAPHVVDVEGPGGPGGGAFDVALLCVPPAAVVPELIAAQRLRLAQTYSDVSSIKTQPQADAQRLGAEISSFVGGHPLAGRERGGPGNARGDLFLGRPWVLTPSADTSPETLAQAEELVRLCGAQPLLMSPEEHDAAVGLVSHLPQALASALAARLTDAAPAAVELAGQGFRDMTRIADSDAQLWGQIAAGNAGPLGRLLRAMSGDLSRLAEALESADQGGPAFRDVVSAGNAGRGRLPGKHGERRQRYEAVPVVVADEPGALARLLTDAGEAGVNVEDLSLEHSPGAAVGLCELLVRPDQAGHLAAVLRERGWAVHHRTGQDDSTSAPSR